MDKQLLESKAISIKGKKYILVSDRVVYFNENYPNGSIETSYELIDNMFVVKAVITPDVDKPARRFSDYSQAIIGDGMVNKTAALENASTSAVGRALAYCGIGVIDSIASVDEINKATGSTGEPRLVKENEYTPMNHPATVAQLALIMAKAKEYSGLDTKEKVNQWFFEKTGMHMTQTKKMEVDNVLSFLESERDV